MSPSTWAADFEAIGGYVMAERDGMLALFVTHYRSPRDHQIRATAMVRSLGYRHRLRRRLARWARQHRRRA